MRKNEMLPTREESILSFTCSLCLSSACRSVTALFSFHLPITSGLLLVGCQWAGVTHSRMNTASGTHPDTLLQCWQLYHTEGMVLYIADKSLHFCAFVGVYGLLQIPGCNGCCSVACLLVVVALCMREMKWGRKRAEERERDRWRDLEKAWKMWEGGKRCTNTKSSIDPLFSSTLTPWPILKYLRVC